MAVGKQNETDIVQWYPGESVGRNALGNTTNLIPVIENKIKVVMANGLKKDWLLDNLDTVEYLLIDPSPQDWQPATEVSNAGTGAGTGTFLGVVVHPVGNAAVRFIAFENGSAVTGSVEPIWTTDGVTTVTDGTVDRPLVWTPQNTWAGPWAATTALTGIGMYNGQAWSSDAGGLSGGTQPTWPSSPNALDTVSDGSITWMYLGPAAVWTPGSRRSFVLDSPTPTPSYSQFNTRSTTAVAGVDYVFGGQPTGLFGTTGDTEPDWGAAVSNDGSTWFDGDVMWSETANLPSPVLVITGIVAPTGVRVFTLANVSADDNAVILLEDPANVVRNYQAAAESVTANQVNSDGSSLSVANLARTLLVYSGDKWWVVKDQQ